MFNTKLLISLPATPALAFPVLAHGNSVLPDGQIKSLSRLCISCPILQQILFGSSSKLIISARPLTWAAVIFHLGHCNDPPILLLLPCSQQSVFNTAASDCSEMRSCHSFAPEPPRRPQEEVKSLKGIMGSSRVWPHHPSFSRQALSC